MGQPANEVSADQSVQGESEENVGREAAQAMSSSLKLRRLANMAGEFGQASISGGNTVTRDDLRQGSSLKVHGKSLYFYNITCYPRYNERED